MTTRTPSWATKIVDASVDDDAATRTTSTRQSANLFRIECARTWQQRIHQAQRKAWVTTVTTMLEPKTREQIRTTVSENSTTMTTTTCPVDYYSIVPTSDQDSENNTVDDLLLPMTIISPPPPCRLDRQAMSEALWDHYQYRSHIDTRCCALWLPRVLPTLRATLHLLVRQCVLCPTPLDQDFQNYAARYLRKQQKKRCGSMKHFLLWWATRTMAFDLLVIIVQDPGGFSERKVWNDFLTTLQELREEHGLPISLVVMGNAHYPAGCGNFRLRHVQCCPSTWMKEFWQELVTRSPAPLPLSSMDQLVQLGKDYALEHKSLTKFGMDLMAHVTSFYSTPSRIVWDGLDLHPLFLAWFQVHGTAKKWLSTKSGPAKYQDLQECQNLQQQLKWWWNWQVKLFPLVFAVDCEDQDNLRPRLELLADLYTSIPKSLEAPKLPVELKRYLDRTGKGENVKHSGETLPLSREQLRAQTLLYELIVLLGHTMSNQSQDQSAESESEPTLDEKMKGIHQMIYDLYDTVIKSMEGLVRAWDRSNPLSKTPSKHGKKAHTTTSSSPSGCLYHRQEVVEGLTSPAKELYGLMQDRLSIPREEWLYQFGGSTHDFVRGVWTLVVLGLVQAKSKRIGTGSTVFYQKVGVVWC